MSDRHMEKARETVASIFKDVRDRKMLKWFFSEIPTVVMHDVDGKPVESIDLDVQEEIRIAWQSIIATALAEAEREGMRRERERASQILAAITDVFRRCDIDNDWTALLRELSAAILSEAGIAVTDK